LLRCSASRRTAPAVSAGRSRKWCRSVTNIFRDCTGPRSSRPAAGLDQLAARRWRAWASR
jgi:hypothetical protein